MNNDELYQKIDLVLNSSSLDDCHVVIELIERKLKEKLEEIDRNKFSFLKKRLEIHILEIKRDSLDNSNYKEKIHLNGKITKAYKDIIKIAPTKEEQLHMKHEHLEGLKKQKGYIYDYRHNSKEKISIPERVGLKIQEISKNIEIFMKEKDILTKFKNTIRQTISGSASSLAIVAGVGFAVQALTGLPFGLTSIASAMPIVAYIGLTSFIRNFTHKTEFQQYEYQQSDEYKNLVEQFNKEHEEEIKQLAQLMKEKEKVTSLDGIIDINDRLIKVLDQLSNQCKIDGVRKTFELQALGYYYENQACCEKIKDDYLEELNDDKERYKENNKRLTRINLEIFKRGNSIKDAVKDAGKSIASGTAIMIVAKAILALISPTMFPLNSLQTIIEPFIFLVINGIVDIPTYVDKLKYRLTDYEGKVQVSDFERLKEFIEIKKQEMGFDHSNIQPSFA